MINETAMTGFIVLKQTKTDGGKQSRSENLKQTNGFQISNAIYTSSPLKIDAS